MTARGSIARSVTLLVVAAAVLAGCTGGSDSVVSDGGDPGAVSGAEPAPGVEDETRASEPEELSAGGDGSVASVDAPAVEDRSVIYTVDLVVEVDDVAAAADEAEAVATRFGGYVQSESTYGPPQPLPEQPDGADIAPAPPVDGGQAVLVLRVPAERYEQAVAALEDLGTTVSRSRNAQDVTEEVVDVESRIESQEASIDRLQALLAEANDIRDILAIETELTSRLAELESLQSRLEQLSGLTELATITVSLYPPETVVEEGTGFVAGLQAGWRAFVRAAELGATAVGALLPFVAFFALLMSPLVIWLVVRGRRNRTARAVRTPAPPGPAAPEPAASAATGDRDG
jgi:hypothetical protein